MAKNIQEFVTNKVFQYLNETYYIGYETILDGDYLPNSTAKICIINSDPEVVKKWATEECCDTFESTYCRYKNYDCFKTHPDVKNYQKFKNGERNSFFYNFYNPDRIIDDSDPRFNGRDHEIKLIRKENGDCLIQENQCDNMNHWDEYRWEIHEFKINRK